MRETVLNYKSYQLRCGYCNHLLEEKATINSVVMEDTQFPLIIRMFCNKNCLLHFRLNGNLCIDGSKGTKYMTSSVFHDKMRELQFKLEQKEEKEIK
jgi:hypothetical protein